MALPAVKRDSKSVKPNRGSILKNVSNSEEKLECAIWVWHKENWRSTKRRDKLAVITTAVTESQRTFETMIVWINRKYATNCFRFESSGFTSFLPTLEFATDGSLMSSPGLAQLCAFRWASEFRWSRSVSRRTLVDPISEAIGGTFRLIKSALASDLGERYAWK